MVRRSRRKQRRRWWLTDSGEMAGVSDNRSPGGGDFIAARGRREDGMARWHGARAWHRSTCPSGTTHVCCRPKRGSQ
jgi:hypothetical protein